MMHATGDYGTSTVPAFLHKLWTLVEDDSTNELICWDSSGKSFHVFDQGRFSKEVLPMYFKHNNIASFIRQLNMYGFRKVTTVDHGGLKIEKDDMEFTHPYFLRGQEDLLEHIKRKVAMGKTDDIKVKHDSVNKVLVDVHQLSTKQDTLNTKFDTLKRENEALWREVATLRQKHHKQQQIVSKLIQFLVTIVGNRGISGLKRPSRMPLMLNDARQLEEEQGIRPTKKARVVSKPSYSGVRTNTSTTQPQQQQQQQPQQSSTQSVVLLPSQTSNPQPSQYVLLPSKSTENTEGRRYIVVNQQPQGATISDVTSSSTSPPPTTVEYAPIVSPPDSVDINSPIDVTSISQADLDLLEPSDLALLSQSHNHQFPGTSDQLAESADPLLEAMTAITSDNENTVAISSPHPHHEMVTTAHDDVDGIHESLENLKDMLAGGANVNIDPSALLSLQLDRDTLHGLFTPEAPVPPTPETMPFPEDSTQNLSKLMKLEPDWDQADSKTDGNQLVQYVPGEDFGTLFDIDLDPGSVFDESSNQLFQNLNDISTPDLELTSPLAQRRREKTSSKTADLD